MTTRSKPSRPVDNRAGTRAGLFQKVPEGKTAKNSLHSRATEQGMADEPGGRCVVLRDPDGNEF